MSLPNMTDEETAAHLRAWCAEPKHATFAWPTDACGYDQHIRFVKHRNANWAGEQKDFNAFVLAYADTLAPRKAADEP